MARSDHYPGLPPAANEFLAANEPINSTRCPCCGQHFAHDDAQIGSFRGAFDHEEHGLYRHKLKDGRTADEFVQAEPWASGPHFFLGLRISDGTEILWPQAEIDKV